jgi:hypothetical protein
MTFRRAGRMHYLGIGRHHAGKRVIAIADDHKVNVGRASSACAAR